MLDIKDTSLIRKKDEWLVTGRPGIRIVLVNTKPIQDEPVHYYCITLLLQYFYSYYYCYYYYHYYYFYYYVGMFVCLLSMRSQEI